jgi:hypothetical protein
METENNLLQIKSKEGLESLVKGNKINLTFQSQSYETYETQATYFGDDKLKIGYLKFLCLKDNQIKEYSSKPENITHGNSSYTFKESTTHTRLFTEKNCPNFENLVALIGNK